jgi:lysophospholipase L1-like esterase
MPAEGHAAAEIVTFRPARRTVIRVFMGATTLFRGTEMLHRNRDVSHRHRVHSAGVRRTAWSPARAIVALAVACGAALASGGPATAASPVPCSARSDGKHDCGFYVPGDGRSGGAPVQATDGFVVGFLHEGRNWVVCQRAGGRVTSGPYFNDNWAWTLADDLRSGWVNAVYASGGDNDGPFGGVPDCGTKHGAAPGGAGSGPAPGAAPPPAAASIRRYVALGDSYSSGEGAFDYLPQAPGRPATCHRSRNAYSQLLAKRLLGGVQHDPARDFLACSGDEVPDLESRQLAALGPDVAVVTVGIGGNDSGWIDVIRQCMVDAATHPRPGSGRGCNRIIDDVFKRKLPDVRRRLRDAYSIIKQRAPQAKVIVVGYPAIFEDSYSSTFCRSVGSLTRGARADLRKAAEQLDGEIGGIARSFGFRFVDPRGAFDDHRICGPAADWIHGVTFGRNGEPIISPQTFHPNPSGQRGFADAIAATNRDVFG